MSFEQTYIENFINYNYTPYSRGQCVKRVIWLLMSCAVCGFVGGFSIVWLCISALIFCTAVVILINNGKNNKGTMQQRFIGDGVFYLAMSLELNLLSYRTFTIGKGANMLLLLVILAILAASMAAMRKTVQRNIAKNNYAKGSSGSTATGAILFSALGVLIAPLILAGESQDAYIMIIASILLLCSILLGVGTMNLMKLRYLSNKHQSV